MQVFLLCFGTAPLRKLYVILGLVIALLSGCSSWHHVSIASYDDGPEKKSLQTPPPVADGPPAAVPKPDPSNAIPPLPSISEVTPEDLGSDIIAQSADDSLLPSKLVDVFFDYDQYYIRNEAVRILKQNAQVLLERYPTRELVIEGHCDERGTEEYNLILGGRRAMAVKNYLVDLGVDASLIRVLSLGKNEPFCLQPTLRCFQQNRRAHFVLK